MNRTQSWRDDPELTAVLAEILVLSVLRRRSYRSNPVKPHKTARQVETDQSPYPAFRAA